MAKKRSPGSKRSRYQKVGSGVEMPRNKIAGKARAQRPGSGLSRGDSIANDFSRYLPKTIDEIRTRSDVNDLIRTLMREEGIFSSAANSMVSLASNSGYRIAGVDDSGTMSLEVMSLAYTILDRINTTHDYSNGYNDRTGVNSLITTLTKDAVSSGGCGLELVLNKDFSPDRLVPVGYSSVEWEADGKGNRCPTQERGEVDLNLPTVFVAEHSKHADEPYSQSPLRPGLNSTIYFNEFLEDTRRAVNRVGHSRMVASIDAEKLQASAPLDIQNDPEKLQKYFQDQYDAVDDALKGLEPEDAVLSFDSVTFDVHDVGGSKSDYSTLLSALGNIQGASLKTPASVTGLRANGGQGLSNAETMVYLQAVDSLRTSVEEVMTRALTLAVRLLGVEGSIRFEFMPINLRPEDELEAYRGSRQKRVMERLSYGMINDAQAMYELGLRPQGLQELLSGTGFYQKGAGEGETAGERETSSGRALNPGTPSNAGGDDQ